jgi:hypothetical protein
LPGTRTPPLDGEASTRTLADALTQFLAARNCGASMRSAVRWGRGSCGTRAARRRTLGAVVSLDPGGFWRGWERHVFFASLYASIASCAACNR